MKINNASIIINNSTVKRIRLRFILIYNFEFSQKSYQNSIKFILFLS